MVHASRCVHHHARSDDTDQPPCFMPDFHEERRWSRSLGETRSWFRPTNAMGERRARRFEKCSYPSSTRQSAIQVGAALQRSVLTTRAADGWTRGVFPRRISSSAFPLGRRSSVQPRLTQTVRAHTSEAFVALQLKQRCLGHHFKAIILTRSRHSGRKQVWSASNAKRSSWSGKTFPSW
jgi:hypothetical protein